MNNFRKSVLISSVCLLWLLSISGGYAHADASESSGFCDCSAAETASSDVICHIPPGNHQQMHTIRVAAPAVHAHLNHGDMPGACPGEDEAAQQENETESEQVDAQTYASCTCADGTTGKLYHAAESVRTTGLRSLFGQ